MEKANNNTSSELNLLDVVVKGIICANLKFKTKLVPP